MTSDHHKRIAKNTLMLYARQILTLVVSLYAVRVTLDVLGVTDYGIYNVIAGIVALFSFFSSSMASATQRFFSFALGEGNTERLNKMFTANWVIYGSIALIAFILLETVGLWFVNNHLNVPPDRLSAALWVYQFSVLTFIFAIICIPYTAMMIAHEDMHIYAYVSIAEAVMRLLIVFLLIYLPWEKLELYGFLVFMVSVIKTLLYAFICGRNYGECQYRKFYWDRSLLREIVGFTGWTLFGQFTSVGRNQAITILLNQVFNPAVVAARAISNSITVQISTFSSNFNVGLYPPIIKSYAAGDREMLFSLVVNGSKITFFLMWVIALPMFLQMDFLLNLWLVNVPPEAVLFTRLALAEVLISTISLPVANAARAPGRMKLYELTLGSLQIAIFVLAWLALKNGGEAYSVYIIAIAINVVMFFARLLIVRSLIALPLRMFFRKAVFPLCFVVILSMPLSYLIHIYLPEGMIFRALSILSSMVISTICMYYLGLNKNWREKIRVMVKNKISKVFRLSLI